jgi:hypothetical protein
LPKCPVYRIIEAVKGELIMANKKKNVRKNSNYQKTYKYVTIDRLCRKTLCDFRNMEPPREDLGEKADVDENLYNTAVELCCVAGVITKEEKESVFDGKNHNPMTSEEVSEFTGIPQHQVEKNLFAFKIKTGDDFFRASMIKLALCDLVATMIQDSIDEGRVLTEEEKRKAVGYINFCAYIGLISDEQSSLLYFPVKQNNPLELPVIASVTGIDQETLQKMMKE